MVTLGQIGVGAWGQNLLRNFFSLKDCRVTMCCDINKSALDRVKNQYGQAISVTANFDDILSNRTIDAVVVATLPFTHAQCAIKALNKGKHVFVEKPMAMNLTDAQAMIRAAKKNKRILMVGHLLLFHPAVKKIKSYINEGILGDIRYLYSTRVNLGQVRSEESALWSLTAHDISVAVHFLNQRPKMVSVTGMSYIRKNIEDVVFMTLKFKNSVAAHIHASWLDPHKMRKFTIVGSKRMAIFDDMESSEKVRLYDKGVDWQQDGSTYETFLTLREGDIHIPKIEMLEPLKLECQHFIDCIQKNMEPLTNGDGGLEVLRVLNAAQKSLDDHGANVKV